MNNRRLVNLQLFELTPWVWAVVVWGITIFLNMGTVIGLDIQVQARATLSVDVDMNETTLTVSGRLSDEFGRALPQRRVFISISSTPIENDFVPVRLWTSMDGTFNYLHTLEPGVYKLKIYTENSEDIISDGTHFDIISVRSNNFICTIHEQFERFQRGILVRCGGQINGVPLVNALMRVQIDSADGETILVQDIITDESGRIEAFADAVQLSSDPDEVQVMIVQSGGSPLVVAREKIAFQKGVWKHNRIVVWLIVITMLLTVAYIAFGGVRRALRKRFHTAKTDGRSIWPENNNLNFSHESSGEVALNNSDAGSTNSIIIIVRDAVSLRHIPGAVITHFMPDKSKQLLCDHEGRLSFSIDNDVTRVSIDVYASKYLSLRDVAIERDKMGLWPQVSIGLWPIDYKIQHCYEKLIRHITDQELWGKLSPIEIKQILYAALNVDVTAATVGHPTSSGLDIITSESGALVSMITTIVEKSIFSGRELYDEDYHHFVELISRLIAIMSDSQERYE